LGSPNTRGPRRRVITWSEDDEVVAATPKSPSEDQSNVGESSWAEFERQASGDVDEMIDEGIVSARLSEHILSPKPKKSEKVNI